MKHKRDLPALAAPAAGLVLPEQLAQHAADALRELLAEAADANTTHSYAAALRYWADWRFGIELTLPVSETVVIQLLVAHIRPPYPRQLGLIALPHSALTTSGLQRRPLQRGAGSFGRAKLDRSRNRTCLGGPGFAALTCTSS